MTEKLGNNVGSTFDDDLYAFVKAAAALSNTDVSGYIRAAMIDLRDKQRVAMFLVRECPCRGSSHIVKNDSYEYDQMCLVCFERI